MSQNIVETTEENFEEECLKADVPVIVDFWAPWCGPCRALAPTIEKLADELVGQVKVCKHNTDENPVIAQKLDVNLLPTVLFFKDGEVVHTLIGPAHTADDFRRILKDHCGIFV